MGATKWVWSTIVPILILEKLAPIVSPSMKQTPPKSSKLNFDDLEGGGGGGDCFIEDDTMVLEAHLHVQLASQLAIHTLKVVLGLKTS